MHPPTPQDPDTPAIRAALDAFLDAPDYTQTRAVLERERGVLLSLAATRSLARRLDAEAQPLRRKLLRRHLEVLLIAREHDIPTAWDWLMAELAQDRDPAEAAIEEMLAQLPPEQRQAVLEGMRQMQAAIQHLSASERAELDRHMRAAANESLPTAQRKAAQTQAEDLLRRAVERMQSAGAAPAAPGGIISPSGNSPIVGRPSIAAIGGKGADAPTGDPGPEVIAAVKEFLNGADWSVRFAVLARYERELTTPAAIHEVERTVQAYRQRQQSEIAGLMEECARILSDARARGLAYAREAFGKRNPEIALAAAPPATDRKPLLHFSLNDFNMSPALQGAAAPGDIPAAPAAVVPPAPPTDAAAIPPTTREQRQAIRELVINRDSALTATDRQTLRQWLGLDDGTPPEARLAVALREALALLK